MVISVLDIHAHYAAEKMDGRSIISLSVGDSLQEAGWDEQGIFYSVGLHPWQVTDGWEHLIEMHLRPKLDAPQVVAVGEAGLDYMRNHNRAMQQEAFVRQALLAEEYGKPLIVHCVKAYDDLIRLHRRLAPSVPWILHAFRGKAMQTTQLLRESFFFSFGAHYHAEALQVCPPDRMFIESDEFAGDIRTLYQKAAAVRDISVQELMAQVRENIGRVFFRR